MKISLFVALLPAPILVGVLCVQTGCNSGRQADAHQGSSTDELIGTKKWSELSVATLEGNQIKLSNLVGKPMILDFWATWCPPCRKQREVLHELSGKYRDQLVIAALSVDQDSEAWKHYVSKHDKMTHELRATPELIERFGVEALPTLVIIDSAGRVQSVSAGLTDVEELGRILRPMMQ